MENLLDALNRDWIGRIAYCICNVPLQSMLEVG